MIRLFVAFYLPLIIAYASHVFATPGLLSTLERREKLACIAVLGIFFAVCVPYYSDGAAALWSQGTAALAR